MLDTFMLSRIQFAANISFHILFPTITIALGWMLVFFKFRHNRTGEQIWLDTYYFWVKIFALTFALGVVSGITMSFQFGTNWPGFMEKVGNIAGPLLGYEVMTAFFMEATFLGIMLFGKNRVPNWVHTLATLLVAIGTTISAFWILVLNSWMHTPTGFEIIEGVVHPTSWFEVIFNPSMPYRLSHMLLASGLTASFLIAGISAYQKLKSPTSNVADKPLKVGITAAAILIPLQIFVGDMHGLNTLEHQPQKIAAMEGVWETEQGAPLLLFAVPNEETRSNDYEVGIPNLASLILTHKLDGEIKGLESFDYHPPVKPLFFGFRIMVGVGVLMLLVSWFTAYRVWRNHPMPQWHLIGLVAMTFSGWVATLSGWYVTEIGRQPWLVQGVLKTADAVTTVSSANVGISLTIYLTLYAVLMIAYIRTLFFLAKKRLPEYQFDDASNAQPTKEVNV
ncbi:cytochrome ubiquinol oxidase subunit I [Salinivibrio sp. ES.052]|uniref:cytochrome ubiquinol oxidase subunit I n=1 Tax=Salinivibrio sp. ES.052 TaxID=1882823 RepID=UPI0009292B2E|nr:cytochrome ubiquinol oxidase subunit I [Salinivibrio sp. ES.052]SIN95516.1 cytochrome bd-I ubiquinol oxidase subunit 1 apoprotein [Salinivibrio sp. ES.052]